LKSPRLYVKNPNWDLDEAHPKIEKAITLFKKATSDAFLHSRQFKHDYNLNPATLQTLCDIRLSKRFCVTATDKNLGPAILEMDQYIERAHSDHLGNTSQYMEISARAAAELDLAIYFLTPLNQMYSFLTPVGGLSLLTSHHDSRRMSHVAV
jgi:hypothetical protein